MKIYENQIEFDIDDVTGPINENTMYISAFSCLEACKCLEKFTNHTALSIQYNPHCDNLSPETTSALNNYNSIIIKYMIVHFTGDREIMKNFEHNRNKWFKVTEKSKPIFFNKSGGWIYDYNGPQVDPIFVGTTGEYLNSSVQNEVSSELIGWLNFDASFYPCLYGQHSIIIQNNLFSNAAYIGKNEIVAENQLSNSQKEYFKKNIDMLNKEQLISLIKILL